jgi:hypothetical protein
MVLLVLAFVLGCVAGVGLLLVTLRHVLHCKVHPRCIDGRGKLFSMMTGGP